MTQPPSPASSAPQHPSRRAFLKTSGAASVAAAASSILAAPAFVRGQNLNSRIQYAGIGTDGKGFSDIKEFAYHNKLEAVAFTDVDLSRTIKVTQLFPEAKIYQDFRDMFAKHGDEIDAVSVSTPDHMHAYIAIAAMQAGKHVYCQKPLTHTVWEARQVRLWSEKSGVITRLGNQIHSHSHYRTAVKLIQDGTIGKIKEVHSWVSTPGHGRSGYLDRPKKDDPVPDSLNWDAWIGVAEMRPYAGDRVYHPYCWRDWQEFGSGAIGDFGCHVFDPVFTALKITGAPKSVRAVHTGMNDEVWPCQETLYYEFPGTEYTAGDTLKITWTDGALKPQINHEKLTSGKPLPRSGSLLIGEKGNMVLPHVGAPQLHPLDQFDNEATLAEDSLNHYLGWLDGCFEGEQPTDGFSYGGKLTEAVQLGNIAVRFPNETLEWDAESMTFPNKPEANAYVTKSYRKGWEITPVA